ncbi:MULTISPECIES: hypothetical protein [Prochlorococcus]|uniref:Uncharacterized protein n=1 Tax=Prochlorococcus marinus (strain SARG / CCMP1375 / SS120) TaxID=167539 RepID=Q7VAQ9_PROMA|nr:MULTISPECIES: hypothetical protein [Prochlorococcus]AAQ00442.1 Predicted protein [Prochlorococcus marinus subsp. marinus str. CCMP1375]KGG14323.1 hypothetical protein EV04_0176 [Prochlorococcus marinus str. LG]KGG22103.1 hypothetical protein EV08_0277 [Prochlorococcus marinus str. SS2]KGG24579.1 hypothetical protein EV09_0211 [Prochlorococcus marinus str. SS35]KGG33472.1 hypothetical protein EV10_0681 [Prochlorococcus marinus str. SS51]
MGNKKPSSEESRQPKDPELVLNNSKSKKVKSNSKSQPNPPSEEVLIKVGGFEYKTPGKRQRIIIGSIVLGLNLLLVLAVAAYFYIPAFQQFVYNVGRS